MYIINNLSEKEILNDLVLSEKELAISYNNTIVESTCPFLRKILSECLNDIQDIQYTIYNIMDERGWNRSRLVNKSDLLNTVEKFQSIQ
ncbi:spore coat protein [Caloranaerobacter sp. DY30410]|uniref:spore coat protein n=1 Tax=Caloranaerobacter sp. DY30410 TaxID=3238305 RepID=UPI003CFCB42C